MSSKDKTREKLLSSMRRTKEGSQTAGAPAEKKPASGNKPANKPAKAAKTSRPRFRPASFPGYSSRTSLSGDDPYQGGARIWPD